QPSGITGEVSGISGIVGISQTSAKKNASLLAKFRALPKRRQYIVGACVLALIYFLLFDEEPETDNSKQAKKPVATASATPQKDKSPQSGPKSGPITFERLSLEQRRFVENQRALAFDLYKNKEYDKAIFEIQKIFTLISDYENSREIERYAKEGKQRMEAIKEENRRKEEEARLKAKIAQLVEETRDRMERKEYEQARELFTQVMSLDPDNADISKWRKEIEDYEERKRMKEQEREVQAKINKLAWDAYKDGMLLKKSGKFHSAIAQFEKVIDMGASDKRTLKLSKRMINASIAAIASLVGPVLTEAKQLEESGEHAKAFQTYRKATQIDPGNQKGHAGMDRIRGVLHEKAKAIYTEAVLAESYSDFTIAKKKFKECMGVAPKDDIYHERAQRKLAHYFDKEEEK
ncbi:MAG: hypothetical protein AABZ06_04525, partial [Bdellovibrionota bacterium]